MCVTADQNYMYHTEKYYLQHNIKIFINNDTKYLNNQLRESDVNKVSGALYNFLRCLQSGFLENGIKCIVDFW